MDIHGVHKQRTTCIPTVNVAATTIFNYSYIHEYIKNCNVYCYYMQLIIWYVCDGAVVLKAWFILLPLGLDFLHSICLGDCEDILGS